MDRYRKPNEEKALTVGYWWWTWSNGGPPPAGTNIGIAFSGWVDPNTAVQDSEKYKSRLPGTKFISLGGGNHNGAWSAARLAVVTNAISSGVFSGYEGIGYDIEEGESGLASAFKASFRAAKSAGFKVLVTISHSAPYGVADASALMASFFPNPDIDFLSPQLYTSGFETQNDYTTSQGVTWSQYASSKAAVVPSIVNASLYADAQSYFANQGVNTTGFIQWAQ